MDHTDIKTEGFIGRLPPSWRPYALMLRLDRPVGWWLLLLPGWWAIALAGGGAMGMGPRQWTLMGLFFAGAIVMRGAGCIVNDLWDRDLDQKVGRTRLRPIASGAVSVRRAAVALLVLLLAGLLILLQTGPVCIGLGVLSLLFIAAYPAMKRITWWPQAFLGLTFNFGALMGWAAVTNAVPLPALVLYAGGLFWTLGYDTIYAHQDREDDVLAGIKSTARLFGARSKIWVAGFYAAAWALIAMAGAMVWPGPVTVWLLLPGAAHLAWQIVRWDLSDPGSALRLFKSNRDFGLLMLAGMMIAPLF